MKVADLGVDEINAFLKIQDLENVLDVFRDERGNNIFNLNKTVYLRVDASQLPEYECTYAMHWPLISYKIYGTTRLAWLLQKLNNVTAKDVFNAKQPRDKVKYLPKRYVDGIVADINNFDT